MQRHVNEKKRFEWLDSQILSIPDTPDFLKHKDIAQIVMDTLIFHNGVRYILYAYCIMPNHVHVIIQQNAEEDGNPYPLPKITQSWKRHSSTQIKRVLNRSEPVWQDESYDHVIRNEQELSYYLEYTIMNPVHAGLAVKWEDWGFTWINPVFL
jgi:REP element-mobilizing transposase RayT